MPVLVLYSLPPSLGPRGRPADEFDLDEAARAVADALPGARLAAVRGDVREVLSLVEEDRPDVVFNACEAPFGRPDLEAHVAALLEWLAVPFTGSSSETLALCRRKDRVNAVLAARGVRVPREGVLPCIVKPADEDGSAGIDASSVCGDAEELASARRQWSGPVVVQEFLPGREFAVSLWGRTEPEHVSIGEFCFRNGLALNTYASKWEVESADFANSTLSYATAIEPTLKSAIVAAVEGAWRAVEARGYLRVDVRLDAESRPCVLDVNPNPELAPGVGIHRAVTEAGWTWERFVRQQVGWA
jgi:D-alanine-D-alanine ligase